MFQQSGDPLLALLSQSFGRIQPAAPAVAAESDSNSEEVEVADAEAGRDQAEDADAGAADEPDAGEPETDDALPPAPIDHPVRVRRRKKNVESSCASQVAEFLAYGREKGLWKLDAVNLRKLLQLDITKKKALSSSSGLDSFNMRTASASTTSTSSLYGQAERLLFVARLCAFQCPEFAHAWQILSRLLSLNDADCAWEGMTRMRIEMVTMLKDLKTVDVEPVVRELLAGGDDGDGEESCVAKQPSLFDRYDFEDATAEEEKSNNPANQSRTLSNGVAVPALGLGLWKMNSSASSCSSTLSTSSSSAKENMKETQALRSLLLCAIQECHVRRFDTAPTYGESEEILADCIRQSGIPRGEFCISTKLPDCGWADPGSWIARAASLFGGYVDVFLIHHPVSDFGTEMRSAEAVGDERGVAAGQASSTSSNNDLLPGTSINQSISSAAYTPFSVKNLLSDGDCQHKDKKLRFDTTEDAFSFHVQRVWACLQQGVTQGHIRAVGVCNFSSADVDLLRPVPHVLQGKCSVFHPFGAYADPDGEYEKGMEEYCVKPLIESSKVGDVNENHSTCSTSLNKEKKNFTIFDGASLVQEVNQNDSQSTTSFGVLSCGGLTQAFVGGLVRKFADGKDSSNFSSNLLVLKRLIEWRAGKGFTGLVRCRTKEHIRELFSSGGSQHERNDQASATLQFLSDRFFDRLHRLIRLPAVNARGDRAQVLQSLFSLKCVPPLDIKLAQQQFQALMQGCSGFPHLVEKLKSTLKRNGAIGALSTKSVLVAVMELTEQCRQQNLKNRVMIYSKVVEMLQELYDTERKSSETKLAEFQEQKKAREKVEKRDEKRSYDYLWSAALRGNSWVWDGFGGDRNKKDSTTAAAGADQKGAGGRGVDSTTGDDSNGDAFFEITVADLPLWDGQEPVPEKISCYNHFSATSTSSTSTKQLRSLLDQSMRERDFAIIDDFLTPETSKSIREEVFGMPFEPSEIWVGQDGGIGAHVHKPEVRGDDIVWVCGQHRTQWQERYFDSAGVQPHAGVDVCKLPEKGSGQKNLLDIKKKFPQLSQTLSRLDEFIYGSITCVGDLIERSDCMVGRYCGSKKARFQRHVDNTQKDGRRLACVLYLNPEDWAVERDGGELRLWLDRGVDPGCGAGEASKAAEANSTSNSNSCTSTKKILLSVPPVGGRLAIFRADRTEHEVSPVLNRHKDRYSLLVWYFQREEREEKIRLEHYSGGVESKQVSVEASARSLVEAVTSGNETCEGLNRLAFRATSEARALAANILGLGPAPSGRQNEGDSSGSRGGSWISQVEMDRARAGIAKMGRKAKK
ncbi:unnamed protein product [Amoebophrya sp. A25]|nr:unnamed protein product [Amoebophrya sp. A25]|eukprot:GSA25T00017207001.1